MLKFKEKTKMKKIISVLLLAVLCLAFVSCGESAYDKYVNTELESDVTVDMYVQATQSWWDNKITVYGADKDGAYFVYELACSKEDAAKLVPGTKITVSGTKAAWAGEIEIIDATFEFAGDDTYVAKAVDVTSLVGKDTLSYIHTGEERYLNAAKQIANYFIANCCDDWIPRVDFRSPSEPVMYDSTAGACAACGLIELAKRLPEHEGGMYMHAALKILQALEANFIDYNPDTDAMLTHGSVLYPRLPGQMGCVHIYIVYADYFYTEAILKILGEEFLPW